MGDQSPLRPQDLDVRFLLLPQSPELHGTVRFDYPSASEPPTKYALHMFDQQHCHQKSLTLSVPRVVSMKAKDLNLDLSRGDTFV